MEPKVEDEVAKMEKELGVKFQRYMVWARTKEFALFRMLDMEYHCEGLPLFYNRKTREIICGATTYDNFFKWASGLPSIPFLAPGWGVADKYKMKEFEKFRLAVEPEKSPSPFATIANGVGAMKSGLAAKVTSMRQSMERPAPPSAEANSLMQRAARKAKLATSNR